MLEPNRGPLHASSTSQISNPRLAADICVRGQGWVGGFRLTSRVTAGCHRLALLYQHLPAADAARAVSNWFQ